MNNEPRVLNKRRDEIPPGAVYVGRPGPYGNPFHIGPDGSREDVVAKYEELLKQHPIDLEPLRGKDLVCWCAPRPCHADILLRLANEVNDG